MAPDLGLDRRVEASRVRPAARGGEPLLGDRRVGTAQLSAPELEVWRVARARAAGRRPAALVQELEEHLAEHHGAAEVVALSNASFGLAFCAGALSEGRSGALALPSFSFRGLPFIPAMLGREARFVDVNPVGAVLDPEALGASLEGGEVAAVMGVHNTHWRCDVAGLDAVCRRHGVPLFYDSVYGIAATARGRPCGRDGRAEVFSMHATKLLNGFEGGHVTTDDPELATRLREMREGVGSYAAPASLPAGHAAMALASLEGLGATVERNRARHAAWTEALASVEGLTVEPYQPGEQHNYASTLVRVEPTCPIDRDTLVEYLVAEGALARPYYAPPLHRRPPFAERNHDPLPETEALSTCLLQLPTGELLGLDTIAAIGRLLCGWIERATGGGVPWS